MDDIRLQEEKPIIGDRSKKARLVIDSQFPEISDHLLGWQKNFLL
jgi:hypothetical protein